MTMTPEAKAQLSTTIRGLRARLLDDLRGAVDSAYRMSVKRKNGEPLEGRRLEEFIKELSLAEAPRTKRLRLEGWLDEQVRIEGVRGKGADDATLRARFRADAEKQAAYTLLNRLVIVRLLESARSADGRPLREPHVVTKGYESAGYKAFRQLAPALRNDDTEGYAFLLQLVFADLAVDLPGLFGSAGIADLVPVPASTLRHVVEALDDDALASCWTDDMTLGWIYQYWNDPEREALDAKLAASKKLENHEIADRKSVV